MGSFCNIKVNGFSPNQLAFSSNPNLPNKKDSKLPAHEGKTSREIVAKILNAMHSAWKAFIKSESDKKIRCALRHQTRLEYLTGDIVFNKRNNTEWWGPETVIGQDGQQVLVKRGSSYIRIYPRGSTLDNSSKKLQHDDTPSNAKNNVAHRRCD